MEVDLAQRCRSTIVMMEKTCLHVWPRRISALLHCRFQNNVSRNIKEISQIRTINAQGISMNALRRWRNNPAQQLNCSSATNATDKF